MSKKRERNCSDSCCAENSLNSSFCGVISSEQPPAKSAKKRKRPTCAHEGCKKRPSYNTEGETRGLYCATHKQEGMIDVNHKTCKHKGCKTRPSYNIEGKTNGLYCVTHKKEGMIDVIGKTCAHEGCRKQPSYNTEGESKALYCVTHKHEGMINVVDDTCAHEGCKKRPAYNTEGEIRGLYCVTHKQEGMVDVKNKTCAHEGCRKIPSYNTEGETKGLYCATHKQEGMVNVISNTCAHEGCRKQPSYNTEGETKALYCATHRQEGMVNVKTPTCKTHLCPTTVQNQKYEGYCMRCFIYIFPDKPVSRNYKTKETAVVQYVKSSFPGFDWVCDKTVSGGCSKKRPDLVLDLGYQVLVVEIDENQHTDYDCSCENKRTMELSRDIGHRPLVFIRFNPDDYKKGSKTIRSCWTINGNGICVVAKKKQTEWTDRLAALGEAICYWSLPENTTDKTVEVVQLFYDQE